MKIAKYIFNPIKKIFMPKSSKIKANSVTSDINLSDSLNIFGNQNKAIFNINLKSYNQVEPLKKDFSSTKELLEYSQKRCLDAINSNSPYEHAVVVDTKKNKVIAEYIGDKNKCDIKNLENLNLDKENTLILHGHPSGYPISPPDVGLMLSSGVNQVLAFNSKGEFSLVQLKSHSSKTMNEFKTYRLDLGEETVDLHSKESGTLYGFAADYMLKKHSSLMGIRYISNYSSL